MAGMEKISEAIKEKVRAEAEGIVKEAESKARETVEKARKQREARLIEEKDKLYKDSRAEADRILAQAEIRGRQENLAAKTALINDVIDRVKKQLVNLSGNERVLSGLIKEGIALLGAGKVRVYVASKDIPAVERLVRDDRELAGAVIEIKKQDILGGVVVEDAQGKGRIDNTFETRLEMLLPKLLPDLQKEIFQV